MRGKILDAFITITIIAGTVYFINEAIDWIRRIVCGH